MAYVAFCGAIYGEKCGNMRNSYLLQVPVILKQGALVADVPVITAVATEGFGLRADEPRVHDLGKVVVGLAEVGQQLAVAVRLGVLCDRAADEMKAEAIGAAVGVYLDLPAVQPLALGLMLRLHPVEVYVGLFKQPIRPFASVAVHELSYELHLFHGAALYLQQRFAVEPVPAGLVEGDDG